ARDRRAAADGDEARRSHRAHVRRVRAPADARVAARPGLQPPHAARSPVEERRLPRPADDRRPCPPPAREARGRASHAGAHPHRARRRLPLSRALMPFRGVGSRLALALLGVVVGALAIVYVIVVPSYSNSLEQNALGNLQRTLSAAAQTFPRESYL